MSEPTENQQTKPGYPIVSRLTMIQPDVVESVLNQNHVQCPSPISIFSDVISNHSMLPGWHGIFRSLSPGAGTYSETGSGSGFVLKRKLILEPVLRSSLDPSHWLPGNSPIVTFVVRETAMESSDRNSA